MFSDHGLCGLLEEGAHGKSPKCLGGNLGDFGEFCKGLGCIKIDKIKLIILNKMSKIHPQIQILYCDTSINRIEKRS